MARCLVPGIAHVTIQYGPAKISLLYKGAVNCVKITLMVVIFFSWMMQEYVHIIVHVMIIEHPQLMGIHILLKIAVTNYTFIYKYTVYTSNTAA